MPPTILVVEDDAPVRDFFIRALQSAGLDTVEAWNAEAALKLIQSGLRPDAVLLDLSMPGIGGFGFLQKFRTDPRHRAIPVAIVTGHLFVPDEVRAMAEELGVAIHHKPVTLEQLFDLTNALLQRS